MIRNKQVLYPGESTAKLEGEEAVRVFYKAQHSVTKRVLTIYAKASNPIELVSFICYDREFTLIGDVVVANILNRDPREVVSYMMDAIEAEIETTAKEVELGKHKASLITASILESLNATKH